MTRRACRKSSRTRSPAVEAAPPAPPRCQANATAGVRLAPASGLAARARRLRRRRRVRCSPSRRAQVARLGGGSRSGWRRCTRRGAGRIGGAWKRLVGRTHGFRGSRARADGVGLRRCGRGFYQCIPRRRSVPGVRRLRRGHGPGRPRRVPAVRRTARRGRRRGLVRFCRSAVRAARGVHKGAR